MEETKVVHKKKMLVPKLRFKSFNESWEEAKLGDVGKIRMCKRIFSHETKEIGEIPFYKIGTFGKEPDAFITNELYLNFKERFSFPKVGDILMSASGTLGRTVVYDGRPAYFQDSNIVWLDNDEKFITNSFLYYIYQIVKYNSEGGTIQRLYNSIISNTKFTKPSIPEQQKIASFLSTVDEKIQLLNRKKQLLEQYKKGVMQQLFSGHLRFKDENGKAYPNWETVRLKDLTEHITKGTTPKKFENSGVYFIKIEGLDGQTFNKEKCLYISQQTHENELKRSILKENDILFAIAGSIGKVGFVTNDILPANTNQAFAIIRLKDLNSLTYIFHILNSSMMKNYINQQVSVGAQPNLNLEQMGNFKFKLPNLEEQKKIADFLSAIDVKIESLSKQINQTQNFKKGLLQQMFV